MARKKAVRKVKRIGARKSVSSKHPDWSDAMYWQFIRAGFRAKFLRYPPKWIALNSVKRVAQDNSRAKWEYKCGTCSSWFILKDVAVDHIIPCGSLKSYDDLAGFVERMFCSVEELQVICHPCHKLKTKKDGSKLKL